MSNPIEPAFPRSYSHDGHNGVTKLEWFTGQALAGMIAGYAVAYGSPASRPDEIAQEAINIAECVMARLAAREVAK